MPQPALSGFADHKDLSKKKPVPQYAYQKAQALHRHRSHFFFVVDKGLGRFVG